MWVRIQLSKIGVRDLVFGSDPLLVSGSDPLVLEYRRHLGRQVVATATLAVLDLVQHAVTLAKAVCNLKIAE